VGLVSAVPAPSAYRAHMAIMRWGPDLVKGPDGHWHQPELGTVHVRRKTDPTGPKSGPYKVVLNGKAVERVADGSSVVFKVNPGRHGLRVRSMWTGSAVIHFDVGPGETVWFVCVPTGKVGFIRRGRHGVELRQVTGDGVDL
jgi:hypothetical protein